MNKQKVASLYTILGEKAKIFREGVAKTPKMDIILIAVVAGSRCASLAQLVRAADS